MKSQEYSTARIHAPLRKASIAFALAWLLYSGGNVSGQAVPNQKPKLAEISVGFQGYFKPGNWTPVDIGILGGSSALTGVIELAASDGETIARYTSTPQQLQPGKLTRAQMYVKFGGYSPEFTVRFRAEDGVALNQQVSEATVDIFKATALNEGERLFLSIDATSAAESAVAIQEADLQRVNPSAINTVKVVSIRVDGLPKQWQGYESVDTLFIATTNPEDFATLRNDSAQVVALDRWVRSGGNLVISSGADAATIFDRGPLELFSPGDYQEMAELRQLVALETYSGNASQIPAASVRAPKFESVRGEIEASEGETPLVIRTVHGFGKIVYTGVDLERAPFANWKGKGAFVNRMLGYVSPPTQVDETRRNYAYWGYNDLSGQLRSALDHFEGIRLAPFSLVFGLVLLYILLIGPGDYFFVKKVLKRMEATWITFPAIVLLFSGGAYLLANWMKGSDVRVNQVNVVDYDSDTQMVRGTTWANVFAPKTGSYDFSLRRAEGHLTAAEEPRVLLSWMGLTGSGLGGMRAANASSGLFSRDYSFSPALDAMQNVPIAIWSTKALEARWTSNLSGQPLFEAELQRDAQEDLSGAVTSHLPIPLKDCFLLYNQKAYQLDTIAAGATAQVIESRNRQIKDVLRDTTLEDVGKGDIRFVTPAYDYSVTDVTATTRAMLFHKSIGGDEYTGIINDYRGFIDMTELLNAGRAVLFGTADESPVELFDGEEPLPTSGAKRWTWYRCVFPVETARTSTRSSDE